MSTDTALEVVLRAQAELHTVQCAVRDLLQERVEWKKQAIEWEAMCQRGVSGAAELHQRIDTLTAERDEARRLLAEAQKTAAEAADWATPHIVCAEKIDAAVRAKNEAENARSAALVDRDGWKEAYHEACAREDAANLRIAGLEAHLKPRTTMAQPAPRVPRIGDNVVFRNAGSRWPALVTAVHDVPGIEYTVDLVYYSRDYGWMDAVHLTHGEPGWDWPDAEVRS